MEIILAMLRWRLWKIALNERSIELLQRPGGRFGHDGRDVTARAIAELEAANSDLRASCEPLLAHLKAA